MNYLTVLKNNIDHELLKNQNTEPIISYLKSGEQEITVPVVMDDNNLVNLSSVLSATVLSACFLLTSTINNSNTSDESVIAAIAAAELAKELSDSLKPGVLTKSAKTAVGAAIAAIKASKLINTPELPVAEHVKDDSNNADSSTRTNVQDETDGSDFLNNFLLEAFTKLSSMVVIPPNFDPNKVKHGWLKRPLNMPRLKHLAEMAASSYISNQTPLIEGYKFIAQKPNLIMFQVSKTPRLFILAFRGLSFSSLDDITATLDILNNIMDVDSNNNTTRNSERYKEDLASIKELGEIVKNELCICNPIYYGVGHSLSGAIIDELLLDGLIKSAVSFNPLVERRNFDIANNNHRVFLECDINYNLFGKFITDGNIDVMPKENGDDSIDTIQNMINCHGISTIISHMNSSKEERYKIIDNSSISQASKTLTINFDDDVKGTIREIMKRIEEIKKQQDQQHQQAAKALNRLSLLT
jgi:hypothetical protein